MEVGNFGLGMRDKNTSVGVGCSFCQAGSGIVVILMPGCGIKIEKITLYGR